jgi:hypothetical protein
MLIIKNVLMHTVCTLRIYCILYTLPYATQITYSCVVRTAPYVIRRIWHPDWPADYKVLEKAYLKAEERKREMSDVSDFLSMGEEFTTAAAKSGKLGLG